MEKNTSQFQMTPEILGFLNSLKLADLQRKVCIMKDLNKVVKPGHIVFAGDSITEGYPLYEMFGLDQILYNRGIGGITAQELLDNIDAHILDLQPATVFLMIGTNDLGQGQDVESTVKRIEKILDITKKSFREMQVFLLSVYPVNSQEAFRQMVGPRKNTDINMLNNFIKEFAEGKDNLTYINVHESLVDENGDLIASYTTDGLHLSVEGYLKVTEVLKPYIKSKKG